MSEAKFTPGPWKNIPSIHGKKYRCVRIGPEEMYATSEVLPADARLIAAAPELYAACEAFTDAMRRNAKPDMLLLIEALHKADAALAKANGGP